MIDPRIEMVDLEPDGFGVVNDLVGKHLHTRAPELHVLHRDGVVLRAVHTVRGVLSSLRGVAIEPGPRAAELLRAEQAAERVIFVDERRLSELAAPLTAAADAATQAEMLVRSRRAFLDADGIDSYPEPARGTWEAWAGYLRALGEDYIALLAGYDGETCVFTLVASVREGSVRRVTSLAPQLGEVRPARSRARELVDAAGLEGDVRLAVVADVEAFDEALAKRSIGPLRARALVQLGLPEFA